MKREYALPAVFSATVLSFVLLGLPQHDSQAATENETPKTVPPPSRAKDLIALAEPEVKALGDESGTPARDRAGGVPRLPDPPTVNPPLGQFVEPPSPAIPPGENVKVIPNDWVLMWPKDGGPKIEVIDPRLLDRVPRARVQMAPEYPPDLRSRQVEGKVVVEFIVDEAGNVVHPIAVSATETAFEETALRAIARWKFEPGTYRGRAVRFRMSIPVMFNLSAD